MKSVMNKLNFKKKPTKDLIYDDGILSIKQVGKARFILSIFGYDYELELYSDDVDRVYGHELDDNDFVDVIKSIKLQINDADITEISGEDL